MPASKRRSQTSPTFSIVGYIVLVIGIIGLLFAINGIQSFMTLRENVDSQDELAGLFGAIFLFAAIGSQQLLYGLIGGLVAVICIPVGIVLIMRR